jgi:hypothetical protein
MATTLASYTAGRGFETLSKWTGPRLYQMAVADPDSIGLRHYQHGCNTERA